MLEIDRFCYIDIHIFDSNLVKNTFTCCRVPFRGFRMFWCLDYHCMLDKKWSVNPFQTLKVQEMECTYSSANFRNYEKKKKKTMWVIKEQNLHKFILRWCCKWTSEQLDRFPCLARDWKSPPQRRIVASIFGKEIDLHSWKVCSTNSVFIIRSQ